VLVVVVMRGRRKGKRGRGRGERGGGGGRTEVLVEGLAHDNSQHLLVRMGRRRGGEGVIWGDESALAQLQLDVALLDARVLALELVREHEGDDGQARDVGLDVVREARRLLGLVDERLVLGRLEQVRLRDDLVVCA